MDGGAAHLGIRLLGEVVACRLVEIDGDVTSTIDRGRVTTGCESGEGTMCGDGEGECMGCDTDDDIARDLRDVDDTIVVCRGCDVHSAHSDSDLHLVIRCWSDAVLIG